MRMRGRAAAYTLRTGVVVRGVITVMPFSLLWGAVPRIVEERAQKGRSETFAVRSISHRTPIAIATAEPPPTTQRR
jgi:hypothetical protein